MPKPDSARCPTASNCGGFVNIPDQERPVPKPNTGRCVSAADVAAEIALLASNPILMMSEATLNVVDPATGAIPLITLPPDVHA